MLIRFIEHLRAFGLKIGLGEYLTLLEGLEAGLAEHSLDGFYRLARLTLIKDEARYDGFDRAFASFFDGIQRQVATELERVPDDWLRQLTTLNLSDEERARLKALGDLDALLQALRERLREQREAHHGGSRYIGTGGTSPFGHGGYNPEGIRIGGPGGQGRAVKVWEQRRFRNYDDHESLSSRQLQLALRRLRQFARAGAEEELDLDHTIKASARQGWLDVRLRPERRNQVRVLLMLDVGGSMDEHVREVERLFAACRLEFKALKHFYFHNCIYEHVWTDARRRPQDLMSTFDLLHTYGPAWRLVVVGDGRMGPYEITHAGGSIEHHNLEAGAVWIRRLTAQYARAAWLTPIEPSSWPYLSSLRLVNQLMAGRLAYLSLAGLGEAIQWLRGIRPSTLEPASAPD